MVPRIMSSWFVLLIFVSTNEVLGEIGHVNHPNCIQYKPPKPDDKSIVFSEAFGRLGNNLLLYAAMYQLQVSVGLEAYVNDECLMYLRKFFTKESIKLKSIQETYCNYDEIQWVFYYKHIRPLLTDKSYRTGRVLYLWPVTGHDEAFDAYRAESHHCVEHDRMVKAYHQTMRNTLEFRPEIMTRVNKIIEEVARKMGSPRREITFVGVHNRRTDHIAYTKKKEGKTPLKPSYFHHAMDAMREDVDHKKMAFLIVSDDMAWAKKNIKNPHGDVFFVGTGVGDVDLDIGTDLALMANANHTIISRGTFSMWGSILCGGEYHTEYGLMVPDYIMDPEDEFYQKEYIL
eukprot:maker-scaffold417_size177606-snap-gene-0.45 protein:Tk07591 transcript:maker-scaffold417_size177606-snap-gene-0.45-mRNA-1 annotation:"galactoside 2-alpha-l-fucosyltransferase 2"